MTEAEPDAAEGFFGGKVRLRQLARGHRAGMDSALLAAAAPPDFAGSLLDAGAGVGAAAIAIAATRPLTWLSLLEMDPGAARLARENLALNGLSARSEVFEADLLSPKSRRVAGVPAECADLVVSNPPFLDPARSRASPDARRRLAHVMAPAGAGAWIAACLALTRPGGSLIVIHRPENLGALIAGLEGRAGEAAIVPVHAHAGAPAIRILLRARKGARGSLTIRPGLVLHGADAARARAILRGDAPAPWGNADSHQ